MLFAQCTCTYVYGVGDHKSPYLCGRTTTPIDDDEEVVGILIPRGVDPELVKTLSKQLEQTSETTAAHGGDAHSARPEACSPHVVEQCCPRGAKSSVLRAVRCRR